MNLVFLFCFLISQAQAGKIELATQFRYVPGTEALTTDRALTLDPDQPNLHRTRWILERKTTLDGLKPILHKTGQFGVAAAGIISVTKSLIRPEGPTYHGLADFPCTQEPLAWFATLEGTRLAAEAGAKEWEKQISVSKVKLEILLSRVLQNSEALALQIAQNLFQNWLLEVTEEWRTNSLSRVRKMEWLSYRERTREACSSGPKKTVPVRWESMMEPVPTQGKGKQVARLPARRWNGLFSVRLNLKVGGNSLNGQFLIDSAARSSIISPDWLIAQGVLPVEVEMAGAPFEKIRWGLARRSAGDGSLAKRVRFDQVELGSHAVDFRDFLLYETNLFSEPESVSGCCAGVIGNDLLKRVVLEIRPGSPNEVVVYENLNFRPEGDDFTWIETASTFYGEMASPCLIKSDKKENLGVVWNTGEELALMLQKSGGNWTITCGELELARGILAADALYSSARRSTIAGDIGMGILGRGPFILDFGHGRIWFSKSSLAKPVPRNDSGLSVLYVFKDGDRALKITGIKPHTPGSRLAATSGLKPGMFLTEIDHKPIEDIDEWEVLQRLSGVYGKTISLKWNVGKKSVVAPLELFQEPSNSNAPHDLK